MKIRDKMNNQEFRAAFVSAGTYQRIAISILDLRLQRGWTQAQLAERIGSKQATIARLENPDNESITVATLLRLSEAFDIPLFINFPSWNDWFAQTDEWSRETIEQQSWQQSNPAVGG